MRAMEEVTVIIQGRVSGFEKVKATKLLQEEAGYGLAEAKAAVDDILNGKDVLVYFDTRDEACDFQERIENLGANAEVVD